ncbi:MAG TPA: SMP-30/gluconolactonase/LRE family protein [Anaeromyxobacteraceae bacterium]|nr:SMP-30/gluconolactonase/LRE family protein [Anaeromyxobacteraceae bacterium]
MIHSRPFRPTLHATASVLAVAAAASLAGGCAGARPRDHFVWPPPPEKARVEYVRSIQSAGDLDPGFWRRFLQILIPSDVGALKSPTGLALSPDGKRLYVACGSSSRIVRVDLAQGTLTHVTASTKPHPGSMVSVAVDDAENLYVSDRSSNSVVVLDRDGRFLRKFGGETLKIPTQLAIDRKAQLLYVISGATSAQSEHSVEVFSLKGEHLRTIGKRGGDQGNFNFPTYLSVGPDGLLYVADMLNFRVQIFDREGKFQSSFGQIGTGGAGAFDKIKGLAFDSFGNLYVVDAQQGVHVLNPARQPLLMFGGAPLINTPNAIAVTPDNHIFVSDFGLNRIHELKLVNTTADDSLPRVRAADDTKPAPAAAPASEPAAPAATPAEPATAPPPPAN